MPGTGLLYVPTEVLQMLTQAIEIGYAAALKKVENGGCLYAPGEHSHPAD